MDHRAYNEEMLRQLASMINAQFEKLNKKIDDNNTKIDTFQQATALQFTNISARLDSLAASVTNISQTVSTSAGRQNPARTTESPSTLESEPHEEKPNIIRAAAATTPTAPAATVIPTPVVAQPVAPVAAAHVPTAPVTAAPIHRPVRQITSPPIAQTAVPEGVARTTTTEPGSWPEQPAEPVAAQNPALVRRSNGSSDAGAARIPQAPQPAAASTVQTVVPPPQTLAQALQNVEESRESPVPSGALPNEADLRQIMTTVPKKRVRAHHQQVYVYDIFFALYVKLFRSNEEPLQYLPLATAKGQSVMFDGDLNVPMGLIQYQVKHIINLIRTLAEYQEVENKQPTLIQRNLRVNIVNRLKSVRKLAFQHITETAMRPEYAHNPQRHPETPANAVLFEPLKRTVSSDASVVSGASGPGVEGSGAAESDADGAEIYDPNKDDEEFVQCLFSAYADLSVPENKKAHDDRLVRFARIKAEPEDDYERPVVLPPSSSNATSSAKTTAPPASAPAAAAAAGGKKKITPGEQEILARTLATTTTQAAREAATRPIPIVNATPASSAAVNRPPAAVPHGTRAGTVNPRAHIASAPIRTEQHFSNGPIRIEHQQNPRVGRQEPGLVNPIQQYPGGPILVRPSMLTNLAPMNYTISGYPNGAHPRSRQNYAPHPSYGMPSGGQFQQLPTKRAFDMGQQQIRGPPAAKYPRY